MAYPPLVRQDGFQLPSPTHTASPKSTPEDDRDDQLFMPHNISYLPEPFRKFPAQAHAHHPAHPQQPIDFADELANLIEPPHVSSHERSTHSRSPNEDTYRHNIFDISAPTPVQQQQHHQDIYQHDYAHFNSTLPALNSSMRFEPHPDPSAGFQYRHSPSPTHRSRSRSRAPSVGPTRPARRDRRANSISSHVSGTSPPPRPHPHAIVIPGRGNSMGGFFVPNGTSAPPDYSLPTPDSLSHSFGLQHAHSQHSQYPYPAQTPSSPYYPTPSMGISPTDVETLNGLSISGITAHHLGSSLPTPHVNGLSKPAPSAPSSASTAKHLDSDVHLSEKRRRRRESHNAVERRRRDNINERIGELAGLIPGVLFECDGPLAVPNATSPAGSAPGPNLAEDLFTMGVLGDSVMHVLPVEDGLPDLPEEGSTVKQDPSEEGEGLAPTSPTSASTPIANKGMILRKSVEYIRYLQQLISVQASRGRDLEERNRALESELALLRGDAAPPSYVSTSSSSPSMASSVVFSMSSSSASASSEPNKGADRRGDGVEDLEMVDGSLELEGGDRSREGCKDELRGRRLGRSRDKSLTHAVGLGLREEGMEI
ncbi:hypothetical protein JVT61DRAFT_10945 [Boletus reticuloceps]|uniref:BHLH domain-containing protein n=1 Tax=Boletus reticuloceps TaxID=495285 RepID=A0A8I2YFD5_9AGAM|nr:hypothetical protein JVT61DRAFT_10945 [Boletus reticuloceps]